MGVALGALVSGLGLGLASLIAGQPAGSAPPVAPMTEAPQAPVSTPAVAPASPAEPRRAEPAATENPPAAPDNGLAVDAATGIQIEAPELVTPQTSISPTDMGGTQPPVADTSTVARPDPTAVATAIDLPKIDLGTVLAPTTDGPVLPAPQADAPTTPSAEADVVVSTHSVTAVVVPDVVEPEVTDEPAVVVGSVQLGQTATLPTGDNSVVIRRAGTDSANAAAPVAVQSDYGANVAALAQFAAAFSNPGNQPMLSVVMIDDGQLSNGPALIRSIPFPITVAIAATDADAKTRMSAYRDAGIEVAAITEMPAGASAGDAAQVIEAAMAILPEAVAILDTGTSGLATNRAATDVLVARLVADGRGLIEAGQGLNEPARIAAAAGVPTVTVARDLDSNDQSALVIRRFLDFNAFQARQQGNTVLLARLRAETVSALTLWATANRAGQVALAPVSAVLLDQD